MSVWALPPQDRNRASESEFCAGAVRRQLRSLVDSQQPFLLYYGVAHYYTEEPAKGEGNEAFVSVSHPGHRT